MHSTNTQEVRKRQINCIMRNSKKTRHAGNTARVDHVWGKAYKYKIVILKLRGRDHLRNSDEDGKEYGGVD